jgi:type IV secretion system protein VirB4
VISASTDNIEVMHRVLAEAARKEGVLQADLTPEQWLSEFYKHRKGSGKAAVAARDTVS